MLRKERRSKDLCFIDWGEVGFVGSKKELRFHGSWFDLRMGEAVKAGKLQKQNRFPPPL